MLAFRGFVAETAAAMFQDSSSAMGMHPTETSRVEQQSSHPMSSNSIRVPVSMGDSSIMAPLASGNSVTTFLLLERANVQSPSPLAVLGPGVLERVETAVKEVTRGRHALIATPLA
jgi:hypothetical protein